MDRILFIRRTRCPQYAARLSVRSASGSLALTDQTYCTGGRAEAWIGIGTLSPRAESWAARLVPSRGVGRRSDGFVESELTSAEWHWVAGGAFNERRARILG